MARWWRGGAGFIRAVPPPLWQWTAASEYCQTIQAVPREHIGGRYNAMQLAAGRIPTRIITRREGGREITNLQRLTADTKQIGEFLERSPYFCSTPVKLQILAGPSSVAVLQSGTVLPLQVKKNKTGQIVGLVLQWAEKGSVLNVDVPVIFKGEDVCPGLKKGGYLLKNRTSLEYLCPSEHIPQKIEVDLSKLDIGGKVLARDVLPHPSLKLRKIVGYKPICKILAAEPKDPKTKLGWKETKTDDPAMKLGRKETKTNDSTTNLGRKETKTNEPKTKPGRKETKANDPKAKLGRKETKTAVGEA
ncbi:50S ribosomal protein L25-like [Zingiber officinale]|uniref:50S ribosomal protein L25-like n=1 Tax=Zingiber officinale TaxID=94328 RepID=UPI001C4A96DC|nr:50S ribosomal protein L25-like [Zingiber officinale]